MTTEHTCHLDETMSSPHCWTCGIGMPESTDYHRMFDCPAPIMYSDGSYAYCACARPLEDFENGYCNELTDDVRGWFERANANPLNMMLFLRARFSDTADRIADIAARDQPMLSMVSERGNGEPFMATFEQRMKSAIEHLYPEHRPTVVSPLMYAKLVQEVKWIAPAELCDTYPTRRAVDFGSGPVRHGAAASDGRWNFIQPQQGNRAARRKQASQNRRKR